MNADVAIAQWQYYLATHDRDWLRAHGWPVIREVARFWASRATYDARGHRYDILHVTSVAESNTDITERHVHECVRRHGSDYRHRRRTRAR